MPIVDQLAVAVASAPTLKAIDSYGRLLWRGLAEGLISEDAAGTLGTALEARKVAIRSLIAGPTKGRAGEAPRAVRRPIRSPDRQRSLERRRRQASSGIVPARIACHFTPGQIAVLTVVGREVQRIGTCCLPIDAIASIAGTCRTVVKDALKEARRRGLVIVTERRRRGLPSLTNVVRVVSPEWSTWLRLGSDRGSRGRKNDCDRIANKNKKVLSAESSGRVGGEAGESRSDQHRSWRSESGTS